MRIWGRSVTFGYCDGNPSVAGVGPSWGSTFWGGFRKLTSPVRSQVRPVRPDNWGPYCDPIHTRLLLVIQAFITLQPVATPMEYETEEAHIHAFHRGIDGGPRWELSAETVCDHCEDNHTTIDVTGDGLMMVCHSCPNWYYGPVSSTLFVDDRFGEIRHADWNLPFTIDGTANKW